MSQSSFSKRTSLWHALSCWYLGTDTSNSPADWDRAAMSLSMAAMLFCCWPEKRKRSQLGTGCQGQSSYPSDGSVPAVAWWGRESRCRRARPSPWGWEPERGQPPSPAPLRSSARCTERGAAAQRGWGRRVPWRPPLPYLVQGLVGIWVSVRKRGFFPEPLPEGVLPDLRGEAGAQGGGRGLAAGGSSGVSPKPLGSCLLAPIPPPPSPGWAPQTAGTSCG